MNSIRTLEGLALSQFGFVHVTGLPVTWLNGPCSSEIQARISDRGKWGSNNGRTVAVTAAGEVWLAVTGPAHQGYGFRELVAKLCLNGEGVSVPCSNDEDILGRLILARLQEPEEDFGGHHLSEPKPRP